MAATANQGPFDDRDGWIWFDGELVPWRDARIHVLTHALHYASSVFEGQRAYNGVIFKLTEHSERLRRSASLLGFELMVRYPGASFLASGGYHHHIAGNIWGSRGAGRRGAGEAGLDSFEVVARDAEDFSAMRERILAAGGDETDGTPSVADPWGNRLVLAG